MGRHEPPTNRSLLLSMAASTLRFAIIVALVVGGVVVINRAFGTGGGSDGTGALPDDGGPTVTTSPPTSPTETETPADQPSPAVAGTVIMVMNAAGVDGLAADTTTRLVDQFDYEAIEPGTAAALSSTTTIYFVARRDRIEAEFLANSRVFRRISETIRVARLPTDQEVEEGVQLVINVGQDYAQAVG